MLHYRASPWLGRDLEALHVLIVAPRLLGEGLAATLTLGTVVLAPSAREARGWLTNRFADVILVAQGLPDEPGVLFAMELMDRPPQRNIILLCDHLSPLFAQFAAACGVRGVVGLSSDILELAEAVTSVAAGGTWFHIADRPLEQSPCARRTPITMKRLESLGLLAAGMTRKEIASASHLSIYAVDERLEALRQTLGARDNPHLVLLAGQFGLLPACGSPGQLVSRAKIAPPRSRIPLLYPIAERRVIGFVALRFSLAEPPLQRPRRPARLSA